MVLNDKKDKIQTLDIADRRQEYFQILLLIALGVYQSIILFGHKVVPISDFSSIVKVGHEILAFQIPTYFKRGPVVGILQIMFGKIAGGQFPDLRGGWLLNSFLHPLNLVLFWLIAKRIIGKTAIWFAIIASITPWTLYMLREPLAETPLLFLILLTTYLIYRNSSWAYLAASVTTMARYEGAALILAAFVMDMIYRKTKREKYIAFAYSALASIPLMLWMLGTFIFRDKSNPSDYLAVFTKDYASHFRDSNADKTGIILHLKLIWGVGFKPLFMIDPVSGRESIDALWTCSQYLSFAAFAFGSIYGLIKKNWYILTLLIFLIPYFLIHAYYPYPIPRFHSTSFWIALMLSIYGIKELWAIIAKKIPLPEAAAMLFQAIVFILSIIMFVPLVSYLPQLAQYCPAVKFLPHVAISIVVLVSLYRCFADKFRTILKQAAILSVMILVVLSNQFSLVPLLGDGQQDIEFKYLADWYVKNAEPGEKMAVYMAGTVGVFAPEFVQYFVEPPAAETPQDFYKKCKEKNITYVVWASREGLSQDHYDYHRLNLDKTINFLFNTKDIGPYKFITQIRSSRGYVNIFKIN